jgi:hypothetical protein
MIEFLRNWNIFKLCFREEKYNKIQMFNPIRHTEGLNNSMRCKLSKIIPGLAIFYPKIYVLYSGMISHGHSKCGVSVFDII